MIPNALSMFVLVIAVSVAAMIFVVIARDREPFSEYDPMNLPESNEPPDLGSLSPNGGGDALLGSEDEHVDADVDAFGGEEFTPFNA